MINLTKKTLISAAIALASIASVQASDIFPATTTQSWIANQPVTVKADTSAKTAQQHPSLIASNSQKTSTNEKLALR